MPSLALSLIMVVYRTNRRKLALPILGFMSCLLLIGAIVRSALLYGILPLFMFVVVMLAMSLMFKQRNADVIEQ